MWSNQIPDPLSFPGVKPPVKGSGELLIGSKLPQELIDANYVSAILWFNTSALPADGKYTFIGMRRAFSDGLGTLAFGRVDNNNAIRTIIEYDNDSTNASPVRISNVDLQVGMSVRQDAKIKVNGVVATTFPVAFANGWANVAGRPPVTVRPYNVGGLWVLSGACGGGTIADGTVVFNLPAAAVPAQEWRTSANPNQAPAGILVVGADGTVTCYGFIAGMIPIFNLTYDIVTGGPE